MRDRKKIAQIKNLLRGQGRFRDLLLFVVGINTALRISDLLQLQVSHVLDEKKNIRRRFWIKERKSGKRLEVVINESICDSLEEYLQTIPVLRRIKKISCFSVQGPQTIQNQFSPAKPGNL